MHRLRIVLLLASTVAAAALPSAAWSQTARVVPVDDPANRWIARLQERGYLASLHPTALPHAWDEVAAAVRSETVDPSDPVAAGWLRLLAERFDRAPDPDAAWVGLEIRPGMTVTSNGRVEPERVLDGGTPVLPWGTLRADASYGGFTLAGGLRHDLYYDRDPDGMDAVLRLYMRSDHAYAGYRGGLLMAHLGRYDVHWGSPGDPALLVSAYPRSMDALHVRFGGPRLALRSLFAELDAVTADGRFTGTAGSDSVRAGLERRWLAAHRVDWRPSPSFVLTLAESVLFSGPGSGWSLKYLNPLQPAFLAVDNRPKNDENNGLVAAMLWWRILGATVSGQLLVDDFDVVHGLEPASAAASLAIVRAGLRPRLDAGVRLTAVTARAYNTPQVEGRYTYLGRGIGAPFSDYVESTAFLRIHPSARFPGLQVEPLVTALWQGGQDYRRPLPDAEDALDTILSGIVERTLRGAVRLHLDVGGLGRVFLDAGVNHVRNAGHVPGRTRTLFVATGGISLRLSLSGPYRLAP